MARPSRCARAPLGLGAVVLASLCGVSVTGRIAGFSTPAWVRASRAGGRRLQAPATDTMVAMGEGFFCSSVETTRFWNTDVGTAAEPCDSIMRSRELHMMKTGISHVERHYAGFLYEHVSCEQERSYTRYKASESENNEPCQEEVQTQAFEPDRCPADQPCAATDASLWSTKTGTYTCACRRTPSVMTLSPAAAPLLCHCACACGE